MDTPEFTCSLCHEPFLEGHSTPGHPNYCKFLKRHEAGTRWMNAAVFILVGVIVLGSVTVLSLLWFMGVL